MKRGKTINKQKLICVLCSLARLWKENVLFAAYKAIICAANNQFFVLFCPTRERKNLIESSLSKVMAVFSETAMPF